LANDLIGKFEYAKILAIVSKPKSVFAKFVSAKFVCRNCAIFFLFVIGFPRSYKMLNPRT